MAQHIPIEGLDQKVFKRIADNFAKDVARGGLATSLKYQAMPTDYYEEGDTHVYLAFRYVDQSTGRGTFEVHVADKKVNKIYWIM